MTDLARELLEDVKVGDYVTILYGTADNQKNASGRITKLTENLLTLDGRIRISPDLLHGLEKTEEQKPQQSSQQIPAPQPVKPKEIKIPRQTRTFPTAPKVSTSTPVERLTGKIFQFGPKVLGRITPNYGFHVGQVINNSEKGILLRKMLFAGLGEQLEVSFVLGARFNQPEKASASGIELTDEGYKEARRRIFGDSFSANRHSGIVDMYYPSHVNGRIISDEDGKIYYFKLWDVLDPWLKAFYEKGSFYSSKGQRVTFEISGKDARKVCLDEESAQQYRETYNGFVTAEEREAWENFLAEKNNSSAQIILPPNDPYEYITYRPLPELKNFPRQFKPAPLIRFKNNSAEENSTPAPKPPIPKFILDMLGEISYLSYPLRRKNLQDEKYIGSVEDARNDVDDLTTLGKSKPAKARSEYLFTACKLIMEVEQRDGKAFKGEDKSVLAGRAIASWGDYMVTRCNQLDTSRMAWLYSISLLIPQEQDWVNSFNRYLLSFVFPQSGEDSLKKYIDEQNKSGKKDAADAREILSGKKIQCDLREFLTGILNLMSRLENFPSQRKDLINVLYENREFKEELAEVLGTEKASSPENFSEQIQDAVALMEEKCKDLQAALNDDKTPPKDLIWSLCLTATDIKRVDSIDFIFQCVSNYSKGLDFNNRLLHLEKAVSKVNELLDAIKKEPTSISYDIFYPMLEQLKKDLAKEQEDHYKKSQPELSWNVDKIQPYRTPDGYIQIHFFVGNRRNHQTAKDFKIIDVQGTQGSEVKYKGKDKDGDKVDIRDGDEVEIIVKVKIGEKENNSGSFVANIKYSYEYFVAMQESLPMEDITKEPILFTIQNEEFEPLENPFSDYVGNVMKDESMFFGRTKEIEHIVGEVCKKNGEMNYGRSIAIYGQTRAGKSSILFHLRKKLAERYGDRILICDLGNISGNSDSDDQDEGEPLSLASFIYTFLYQSNESVLENEAVSKKVHEKNLKSPHDEILDKPNFCTALFNTYMSSLSSVLKEENRIIILIVDEFTHFHDQIKAGNIPKNFMAFWKAMLENNAIFAVMAGQDDMLEFMSNNHQSEFESMETRKITYLPEIDAKRLIREPLERANKRTDLFLDEEPIEEIYKLTAGGAYLTILLCSELVDYLNYKGASKITKGILNDFLNVRIFGSKGFLTDSNFESQLQERGHRELDAINKKILHCIARLSQKTGYADIKDITCDDESAEQVAEWVERLANRDVLVKEGGRYRIQVKLLELWLLKKDGV